MIKKITDPKIYSQALNSLDSLFRVENEHSGHQLKISKKRLYEFANKNLLTWSWHVWAHEENNQFDGLVIFSGMDSPIFEEKIATEILWLSKNPKISLTLLRDALQWLKQNGYSHFIMGKAIRHPNSNRLNNFYRRLNLELDGETFIGTL